MSIVPSQPTSQPTSERLSSIRLLRALCLLLLGGLVALCLGWELWWAPVHPGGSWLALKALPVCLPVAGMLKNRLYTYRWLSLLVWLYFTEGAVRSYSDPTTLSSQLALAECALSLALFTACTVYIRRRLRPL